ncbi:MAG TPA: hypothetical protein PLD47_13910 [Aggregatilineales bacterium]|nr:hypothetical protein [Aggregatilineales bacterium]
MAKMRLRIISVGVFMALMSTAFGVRPAAAQDLICFTPSMSSFNGWTTTAPLQYIYPEGESYVPGIPTTGASGQNIWLSGATYNIRVWLGERAVQRIKVRAVANGFSPGGAILTVKTFYDLKVKEVKEGIFPPDPVFWVYREFSYYLTPQVVDTIEVAVVLGRDASYTVDMGLWIDEICYHSSSSFPTPTPRVVIPTGTPPFTNTPTRTRTPTRTLPSTWTPAPTSTPGGVTDTPVPTWTGTPPPTMVGVSTPDGFDNPGCIDPSDPCSIFPVIRFPTVRISTLTPVAILPTLTPLPSITNAFVIDGGRIKSITPAVTPPTQTGTLPPISGTLPPVLTPIAMMLTQQAGLPDPKNLEGTPVAGLGQAAYDAGARIGWGFGIMRQMATGEFGRVGSILSFIFALIALNLLVRLVFFFVPIAIKFFEVLIQLFNILVTVVSGFIDAITPW